MRQEEIQAVSEALAILSSDDAHDTFTSARTIYVEGRAILSSFAEKHADLAGSRWSRTTPSFRSAASSDA